MAVKPKPLKGRVWKLYVGIIIQFELLTNRRNRLIIGDNNRQHKLPDNNDKTVCDYQSKIYSSRNHLTINSTVTSRVGRRSNWPPATSKVWHYFLLATTSGTSHQPPLQPPDSISASSHHLSQLPPLQPPATTSFPIYFKLASLARLAKGTLKSYCKDYFLLGEPWYTHGKRRNFKISLKLVGYSKCKWGVLRFVQNLKVISDLITHYKHNIIFRLP